MKRFVQGCLAALLLASNMPVQAETFAAGDKVIAVWGGGTYYSATVKSVEGDQAIVAWDDGSSPSGTPVATMMRRNAADAKLDVKVGDAGYCNFSGSVYGPCLVAELTANGVKALNPADESTKELAFTAFVLPTGEVAVKLNTQVESAKKALELKKSIQAQKGPAGTGAATAQKGDWVLALWTDGKYWEARVMERQDSAVKLLWADGQITEGYDIKNVAAYPSLDQAYDIKAGDVIYVKWSASPTWYVARVQNALGADAIDILYQDGTTGKTRRGRYLPQAGTATK